MASATQSTNKRKHVTTACVPCRESKVKCDGQTPCCSNCKRKGKNCQFQANEDKRKLSLRVAIELLCARVDQLTHFIEKSDLLPPPMQEDDETVLLRVLKNVGLIHAYPRGENSGSMSTEPDKANSTSVGPDCASSPVARLNDTDRLCIPTTTVNENVTTFDTPQVESLISNLPLEWREGRKIVSNEQTDSLELDWDWHSSDDLVDIVHTRATTNMTVEGLSVPNDVHAVPDKPERTLGPSISFPTIISGDDSDAESTEELVDRLSERVGSLQIGSDGQIRYYGPTSNFNLVQMPAPDNMTVHRTVRNDGQEYLDRLEIGKDVPNDIEDHLVNLYFTWQDPASHVVQREMYQKAKVQWCDHMVDNPYYSEALRNSICALGAAFESRHHPTFVTFPKSLADFFADRAKALLDIELDCPSVATVQAMVILSGHDIGCKRDARGWLYSGMAMRLAFDLALHVDMTPYVRTGSISQEEADLRKTVFWGAYTVDHLWGLHLGRPFRINMEDVTVAKPGIDGSISGHWSAYVSPDSCGITQPDHAELLCSQRALLCDIMAPLGHALYGSQRIPPSVLQEMNQKTVKELKEWKDCLPSVLQVQTDEKDTKTPYLPHVLLLHMHYHQAIIHAHRPWMSKHYIQPQPPQGPGHIHARKACVDSAVAIAKILQLYEERYTLKRRDVTTWEYS
ncbi:hypothetical protein CGMCC3_g10266 [Colletotrichum fructicola]|nr:uncharacterized protein CGMCC3_g10266 [Colletotrichum fructicola]KAE9573443.1 hypothetical protein CGMCC3_g10266 [Colletotrichum fructicola]